MPDPKFKPTQPIWQKYLNKYDVNGDGVTSGDELKFAAKQGLKSLWTNTKPIIDSMADTTGGTGINTPDGKATPGEYAVLAASFIFPGSASKGGVRSLINKATNYLKGSGVVAKTASKNIVSKVNPKTGFIKGSAKDLGADGSVLTDHYRVGKNDLKIPANQAWDPNQVKLGDNIKADFKGAFARNPKVDNVESIGNNQNIMTWNNGEKKMLLQSTSGGNKSVMTKINGVDTEVSTKGIYYGVSDRMNTLAPYKGKLVPNQNYYKKADFEDLPHEYGRGTFVPNAKDSYIKRDTGNKVLGGQWSGGVIDNLIKGKI
tara:strand:- start:25 stop:972 length:948 start_codon:yes stop_codon:yes gene_type:complete